MKTNEQTKHPESRELLGHIIADIAQNMGLQDSPLETQRQRVLALSPKEQWRRFLEWNGIIGYESTLDAAHRDIFGEPKP